MRAAFPADKPVTMRVSGTDWVEGGWDIAQTVAFAEALDARGCSAIHVSSGGLDPRQAIPVGPSYQVPLARAVKQAVKMPVVAVGMITDFEQAEAIVGTGDADLVALARAMLYDPRWPWHAAAHLGASVKAPSQYLRSQPRQFRDLFETQSYRATLDPTLDPTLYQCRRRAHMGGIGSRAARVPDRILAALATACESDAPSRPSTGLLPMAFRPLHDRVLIRRIEAAEKTAGGIIIPDTAKEKPQEGEVVSAGSGARAEDGTIVALDVKAGDKILFGKWSGTEVKIDGEDLLIMKESDILGIVG